MPPYARSKPAVRGYVSLLVAIAVLGSVAGIGTRSAVADPTITPSSDAEAEGSDTSEFAITSASVPAFADLEGNVHRDAVDWLAANRLVQGHADGTFRPADLLTRGQLASLLARALEPEPAPCTTPCARLVDLESSVHAPAIRDLLALGITNGYPDGTYRPNTHVTRGQMATFMAGAFELSLADADHPFTDVAGTAHEAEIAAVATAGFTKGATLRTFEPDNYVRRDQMASLLSRSLGWQPASGSSASKSEPAGATSGDEPSGENLAASKVPADWQGAFDSRDIDVIRAWYRENTGHEAQGYGIEDLEYVGHMTTQYDGQMIEGVHAESIRIAHDDVTIRNSRITSAGGSGSYGLAYQDTWGQENGGTLIEFVTFDGWHGDVGNVNHAVYLSSNDSGATVRRVNISGYSSGVSMRGNTSFEESWVHQLYRGKGTGHGTSSTIRGPHNAAIRNLLEGPGGSSALSLYADHGGALHNALVEYNVMNDSNPYYQINAPNREYSSQSENVRVRHNRFGPAANSPHITGTSNFKHPSNEFRDNKDL